jgi:hypothetical protein
VNLSEVVILHANWLVGRKFKYERLVKWGVWALSPDYDFSKAEHCNPAKSLSHFERAIAAAS